MVNDQIPIPSQGGHKLSISGPSLSPKPVIFNFFIFLFCKTFHEITQLQPLVNVHHLLQYRAFKPVLGRTSD
jgi:hypothetical protein